MHKVIIAGQWLATRLCTMSEYLETINAMKKRYKLAALTNDWLGFPIPIFKVGGHEEPPALVVAGASGIEAASVYAALELLVQVDIERTTYILPSRDPTGLHDMSFVLSKLLGTNVSIESADEARKILVESGAEVVINDNEVFLALVRGIGIAIGKKLDAFSTISALKEKIKEGLFESLESTRILVASQLPQVEGVGEIGRFATIFVEEGNVLTYDDIDKAEIPEVSFVRDFIDKEELGLVIDLHESKGPAFYALTGGAPSSIELTILYVVMDQIKSRGLRIASTNQLKTLGLAAAEDGIGYGPGGCGLVSYASSKAYAMAFVAPIVVPLEDRSRALVTAALSALNAYIVVSV